MPHPLFEVRTHQDAQGQKLNYRLLRPLDYDPRRSYPLILFLHGAGERGSDNERQLNYFGPVIAGEAMMMKHPCFVIAPQVPPGDSWVRLYLSAGRSVAGETPAGPMALTIELLGKIREEFSLDPRRLYVTGLSMGGYGTWDILWRLPGVFAAGAPICGGGDLSKAPLIAQTPVWAFHGTRDPIVPVEESRGMVEAVKAAGGEVLYTEYPNEKHESWIPTYHDPELYTWLFAHSRP